MLHGWLRLYRTSIGLGFRALARGHRTREAVVRIAAPVEDVRFIELPALLTGRVGRSVRA